MRKSSSGSGRKSGMTRGRRTTNKERPLRTGATGSHVPEPSTAEPEGAAEARPLPPASAEAARGRPGRRTAEERRTAVLELLGGKATVDQLARRFGGLPSTIEGWRADALEGR